MPTKAFTFFATMFGISLIGSRIPIVSQLMPFLFPLVYLVSGWKYAGYYLALDTAISLPQWVNMIGVLNMLPPPHEAGTQLNKTMSEVIHASPIVIPPWILIVIGIGILGFCIVSLYFSYLGFKTYIKTLLYVHRLSRRIRRQ